jgi:Tol biopolymer transport system component
MNDAAKRLTSPDGRWLAYESDASGCNTVYLYYILLDILTR